MNCEKYFDSIDDFVEGELDAHTAARVDSHIFACPSCRERCETLKREREIYARYLFDAEPPQDLWTNFQAKLETEKTHSFAEIPAESNARKSSILAFRLWFPATASAALVIAFAVGFGWQQFAPNESSGGEFTAENKSGDFQPPKKADQSGESKAADSAMKIESGENNFAALNKKFGGKAEPPRERNIAAVKKPIAAEFVNAPRKTVVEARKISNKNKPEQDASSGDKRLQKLRLRNLELEIAGQIERVEMLLRSFRNARALESSDAAFDVAYERGQARRLLERNVRLRHNAENYEIKYAEELLSRVEPYLLDIANLAANPAPETVLDIKERVKNQSIIASLQIY